MKLSPPPQTHMGKAPKGARSSACRSACPGSAQLRHRLPHPLPTKLRGAQSQLRAFKTQGEPPHPAAARQGLLVDSALCLLRPRPSSSSSCCCFLWQAPGFTPPAEPWGCGSGRAGGEAGGEGQGGCLREKENRGANGEVDGQLGGWGTLALP